MIVYFRVQDIEELWLHVDLATSLQIKLRTLKS
jgi:hypothetical protein